MHLFHWETLLYLSFHAVGFFFCFVGVIGIPGNVDETKPLVKKVNKAYTVFYYLSWNGIPALLLLSLGAFYVEYTVLARIFCTLSMSLGLGLFCCLMTLYRIK